MSATVTALVSILGCDVKPKQPVVATTDTVPPAASAVGAPDTVVLGESTPLDSAAQAMADSIAHDPSPVFFKATVEHRLVRIDPIAILRGDILVAPPIGRDEPITQAFRHVYYDSSTSYELLVGNTTVGTAHGGAGSLNEACVGLAGLVTSDSALPDTTWHGLALAGHLGRRAPRAAAPSPDDLAVAKSIVDRQLRAHQVPDSQLAAFAMQDGALVFGDSSKFIAVVAQTASRSPSGGVASLFVIARLQDGEPVFDEFSNTTEEAEDVTVGIVDVIDLGPTRGLGLVVQRTYYEAWRYSIYVRKGSSWERIYEDAGGGC
jgi:hypothetical protein